MASTIEESTSHGQHNVHLCDTGRSGPDGDSHAKELPGERHQALPDRVTDGGTASNGHPSECDNDRDMNAAYKLEEKQPGKTSDERPADQKTPEHGQGSGARQRPSNLSQDRTYRNNLMWAVGLLELSNAMDFPANIFNQIPVPLFAQVLMGLGGSIAILWSIFPFLDLRRSLRNVELLRKERRLLQQWQHSFDDADTLHTRSLVRATLDVNLRELGWELIDRVLMDVCAGVSGVLVGTGALMAIKGDIPDVFLASNLLSGYIGNSMLAPFALANSIWAVFMWNRAAVEYRLMNNAESEINNLLRAQMVWHGRKHRFYALLNGLTAVVGTVGSIMSATLWYGYVVIAPCVFTLMFCNLFWRHQLGYNRLVVLDKKDLREVEIEKALLRSLADIEEYNTSQHSDGSRAGEVDTAEAPRSPETSAQTTSAAADQSHAVRAMSRDQYLTARDQKRYLLEVNGRYLHQLEEEGTLTEKGDSTDAISKGLASRQS